MDESLKLLVSLLGGAVLGVIAKAWQTRTKVSLLISSVDFKHGEGNDIDELEIPESIRSQSKKSRWTDNLPEKMKLSELRKLIDDDLNKTVDQLDNLCEFLPLLLAETKKLEQMGEDEAHDAYMHFFANNASAETMSYYTLNIASALRRKEIEFPELSDWLPAGTKSPLDKESMFPRGVSKLNELLDKKSSSREAAAVNALKIATQWHPQITKKVAETILQQVSPQAPLNRSIFEKLSQLISTYGGSLASRSAVVVRAALVNHGELPISVDRYAALRLPGNLSPVFLTASSPSEGYMTLTSGQTLQVTYQSGNDLTSTVADSIKGLFSTRALTCRLITRVMTRRLFQKSWIKSDLTTMSDLTDEVVGEYIRVAKDTRLG